MTYKTDPLQKCFRIEQVKNTQEKSKSNGEKREKNWRCRSHTIATRKIALGVKFELTGGCRNKHWSKNTVGGSDGRSWSNLVSPYQNPRFVKPRSHRNRARARKVVYAKSTAKTWFARRRAMVKKTDAGDAIHFFNDNSQIMRHGRGKRPRGKCRVACCLWNRGSSARCSEWVMPGIRAGLLIWENRGNGFRSGDVSLECLLRAAGGRWDRRWELGDTWKR